jgi:DNA-directed RNA polymerase specialized sigma24 family protein
MSQGEIARAFRIAQPTVAGYMRRLRRASSDQLDASRSAIESLDENDDRAAI